MITSPNEYWSILYRIQDKNSPWPTFPIPATERIYNVDMEKRTIEAPEFLSVQHDHKSEWIYFRCPRYYDHMDLANVCCVIQYTNANGDNRIYPVPFYDTITEANEQNLLVPWNLDGDVTHYSGEVEFAIRFYSIDADNQVFSYSLNTQPTKSKVLYGMDTTNDEVYNYDQLFINELLDRLSRVEKAYDLYWLEVK